MMKKLLLLNALFICCFKMGYSQPGALDFSFGKNGIVKTELGAPVNAGSAANQVLLLSDGSVYVIFESSGLTIITKKHADGSIDSSYGQAGFSVSVAIQNTHAILQSDGKIVVAGKMLVSRGYNSDYDFALARYKTDGTLDLTFGLNGMVTTNFDYNNDIINSIVIQADGKIFVAGTTFNADLEGGNPVDVALARYNSNGSPDNTFDGDGKLITQLTTEYPVSAAIGTDGKIVVAGSTYELGLTIARYYSNGSADNTFAYTGNVASPGDNLAAALAIQSDGKIVVGGEFHNNNLDFSIIRININGSLDNTFGNNGIQLTDFRTYNDGINSIAIQTDGKIVAAGYASNGLNYAFAIARYNINGSMDNTFDADGKKMTYIGSYNVYAVSLAIQSNGKFVSVGYNQTATNTNIAIAKYNTDGSLDNTFNKSGTSIDYFKQKNTVFTSTAVQKDGKIVAAGYTSNGKNYDFAVVRYNYNGSLDNSFSSDGIQTTDFGSNEYAKSIALQSDGKIVVAGGNVIARYNIDGSLDNTFSSDGKQTASFAISTVKIQQDGKIAASGGTTLARYNTDGSIDVSFSGDGKIETAFNVNDLALQGDDKIVAVGGAYNALTIARYNKNGTPDNTFDGDGIQTIEPQYNEDGSNDFTSYNATSVRIQIDGKLIIGGVKSYNYRYGRDASTIIASFNPEGSLNYIKEASPGISNTLTALIALQTDGKIVVTSNLFSKFNVEYRTTDEIPSGFAINRFNTDGNVDTTFGTKGTMLSTLNEVVQIQGIAISNDKLYAASFGKKISNYGFLARYLLTPNKAPTVKITSPANNTVYAAPATFTINASAADSDGIIHSVKFYNGTTYLKTDFTSPYTYTISNLPAGTYSLTAKATDNAGAQTISAAVIVKVNKAPTVSITTPTNNANYTAPANITVNVLAADRDGSIHSVKFYNGTTYLKTDFTSPYTYTLYNLPAGTYSLTAKATDNNGAQTISAPVTVTVSNTSIVSSKPFPINNQPVVSNEISLKLAPNPATNVVNISIAGLQQNKQTNISVLSVAGVAMKTMQVNGLNQTVQLDVSSLPAGVYTIKMLSGDKVIYKQFVKL